MVCIRMEELPMKPNRQIALLIGVFCILMLVIATAAASGFGQTKFSGKSLVAGNRTDSGTSSSGPHQWVPLTNGTAPCGPPPDGVMPNGTHPSGPPGSLLPNGTAPCAPPSGGIMPNGTPPSGTPPEGPVPASLSQPGI